jgi:hypothetical protein
MPDYLFPWVLGHNLQFDHVNKCHHGLFYIEGYGYADGFAKFANPFDPSPFPGKRAVLVFDPFSRETAHFLPKCGVEAFLKNRLDMPVGHKEQA